MALPRSAISWRRWAGGFPPTRHRAGLSRPL